MIAFYHISILLYVFGIKLASLFNKKAKLWVDGRKNILLHIKISLKESNNNVWFHCASLGEYEQARPVIEKYKCKFPSDKILVTFFSPSGYEQRKNEPLIDYCFYLPIDTLSNAKEFIELVKPKKVFFVKYEFWFNYINQLKEKNISTYLISGVFRPNQLFFKWYGKWYKKVLYGFTHFFVQNEESKKLLNNQGFRNVTLSGDTRFDRVNENATSPKILPIIKSFKDNKTLVVGGSTWKTEEQILSRLNNPTFKLVIAPHDISEYHIKQIEKLFKQNCLRYSQANTTNITGVNVLIIDNIGILSNIYQYADLAFIGGGFTGALHNILEPASFGNVVFFGPKHHKFHEAQELIDDNGAFEISNIIDFEIKLKDVSADLNSYKKNSSNFIKNRIGATSIILNAMN